MPEGKDQRDSHFVVSMIKSSVRLVGCFLSIAFQSVTVLAVSFLVAEILGIYEEL
jgi:hypothetical protein